MNAWCRALAMLALVAAVTVTASGCVVAPVAPGYAYAPRLVRPVVIAPAPVVVAPAPVVVWRRSPYYWW